MYRRPRKRPYIGWLAVILVLAVIGAAVFGVVKLLMGTPNIDEDAALLFTPETESIFPWKDGVLCIYGRKLICNDMEAGSMWDSDIVLPVDNMKARREGDLTVAWGGKNIMVIDKDGNSLYTLDLPGEVVMAVPGITTFAAILKEENQHRLRVYTVKDHKEVDNELFPFQSVLGLGFFGDKMNQLWTLAVDSHGTQPMTKLTTYYPGKTSTGGITLRNEVGYAAVLHEDMTYIVGTHTLTYWENASEKKMGKLIYGWSLQDVLVEGNGRVSFLFAPAGGKTDQISQLWYINTSGDEYRIPLPAGCIKAMLKDNGKICAATRNGVYSMSLNGSNSRFYPLAKTVESIPVVVPGKAFVIHESRRNYLVKMP